MIIDCLFAVAMSRAGSREWSAEVIIDCLFAVAMSRAGVQRVVSRGDNRLFVCCGYIKS